MKLQVSNTNVPTWRDMTVKSDLPAKLKHLEELAKNLERGEQSILFLNRRGASPMVTCVSCGQVPSCPHCSAYLTYHSANGRLMCHHCG